MMRNLLLSAAACIASLLAGPAVAANVWTPIGPEGGEILSLAADARQPGVVYAGTRSGLFKSTNGGTTWIRSNRGLRHEPVVDLAVAPSDSSVVYAVQQQEQDGVYVSFDAGTTWQATGSLYGGARAVAVDPRNPRRVWAGASTTAFWSDDAGATWRSTWPDIVAQVYDVAIDPFRPDTIYLATTGMEDFGFWGVLRSTDAGATWEPLDEVVSDFNENFVQLATDPTTPGLLYASFLGFTPNRPSVTWRSTDRGTTWHMTDGGYPIAVDRQGVVFAGDRRSTDHGQTWQTIAEPPTFALRYAVTTDGTLCAATESLGIYRSRDRAATWEPARRGLYATTVMSLAIHPESPRVIYASESSLYKTLSSGAGWQRLVSGSGELEGPYQYRLVALDPQQPQTVYLTGNDGGFARSDDGGAHWTLLWDRQDYGFNPFEILVDPTASNIIFLTGWDVGPEGTECGAARSTDGGATFQCITPQLGGLHWPRVVADPSRPGTFWLGEGEQNRLWKSTDHGAHWKVIQARGLKGVGFLLSLAVDPTVAGRLYAGTGAHAVGRPERIWRSDDGGLNWRGLGSGLPVKSDITHLLVDARQPNILYAAVKYQSAFSPKPDDLSGVYWSRDGGKTFRPAGITGTVLQLTQDPKNPRKLYASIEGRGIYIWIRP